MSDYVKSTPAGIGLVKRSVCRCLAVTAVVAFCGCALPPRADLELQDESFGVAVRGSDDSIPRPVAVSGHSRSVRDIALSPDGKHLFTASADWSIIMWNIAEQTVVRRFAGHKAGVTSIDVSGDGNYLASGSEDETVRVWDLNTGAEIQRFVLKPRGWHDLGAKIFEGGLAGKRYKRITSVAFAPGDQHVLSGSEIGLWLVDWTTGEQVRHFDPEGLVAAEPNVKSIAFSADGRQALTASSHAELWDVASGRHIGSFERTEDDVVAVAFAPSGPRVVTSSKDGEVRLWNFDQSSLLQRFKGHSAAVLSADLSSDGLRLLTGGADETVRVWDVATGAEIMRSDLVGNVNSVAFYLNESFVIGAAFGGAELWSVTEANPRRRFYGDTAYPPQATAMSGRLIANGDASGNVVIWDLHSGQRVRRLQGHSASIETLAISRDGTRMLSGSADRTMRLWDLKSGEAIGQWTGFADSVTSVAFSQDQTHVLSASKEEILLWRLASKQPVRRFGSGWTKALGGNVEVAILGANELGNFVAATYANYESGIRVWHRDTGELAAKLGGIVEGHRDTIRSIAFHPREPRLLSGAEDKTLRVWDLATGKEIKRINLSAAVRRAAYHPDGRHGLVVLEDNTMQLWDLDTDTRLRSFRGHWSEVQWASFSRDGVLLISVGSDSTQRVWDTDSGEQLAIYVQTLAGEWLVYTPDGLFDGSTIGWASLAWRFREGEDDTATLPIEIFFKEYFYPQLLSDLFAGKRPSAPREIARVDRRQPRITIAGPDGDEPIEQRRVSVTVEVHDVGSGMQDLRVFRNGTLIHVQRGVLPPSIGTNTFRASVPVTLVAGENEITAYAFNRDDIKSNDAWLSLEGAQTLARKGRAYVVAVGVDEYQNQDFNLRYAVADARLVAEGLSASLAQLNVYEEIVPVEVLDEQASKANILALLDFLSGRVTSPPAGVREDAHELRVGEPEDLLIVYFAGHGMAHRDQYYLVPHDLGYTNSAALSDERALSTIRQHSLSDRALEAAFERIDAERIMLIIDACQSGQALEAEETRRGPMNVKGLAQLAYEKGMYILAAAQSHQAALELDVLGHGLLTHVLMQEGLKKMAADANGDGELTAPEWLDYPAERMTAETEPANQRHIANSFGRGVFPVGEERSPGETASQRPKAYYRRQNQERPWIIAVD